MKTKRVALITGSTSGIGMAIAKQLSQDGFSIAFHSKSSWQMGRELAKNHSDSSYTQADLADQKQIRDLISSVISHHGRLDILVNNAGINAIIPHHSLKKACPEIWRNIYEINVIAPWTLITEAEQVLRESSNSDCPSCILNISSHAGIRPKGGSIPYATSKAALNHMTRLLALSLAPEIRVNAIAPGLVNTPMTENWIDAQKTWQQRSPMKRGAKPEEIAQLASMIVKNNYLTGEIIICDGGLNLT
ncbi:short-chain dehydrogenase/reductase SDR [Geminocystis sp. NIES-3708]|uniref:SDR family NAD(P)-dependent oxidoreductase n=1 Tax=Geminocystis sp. NIES-3708 TaxID=1615909 RepID=UPI0005FC576F|nr:SDR family oxidoreductase [Geminocystis sp. NIES-3708]BAQ62171.1 short-chain dehydrogenase/reductase SDR [Geminocystis sp. NIES-3708]